MTRKEKKIEFYDIELIDVSENIENFKFTGVPSSDLDNIKNTLKDSTVSPHFEFESKEGNVFLISHFFRGIMFRTHSEIPKSTIQENKESSVEVKKIKINKPVACSMKGGTRD